MLYILLCLFEVDNFLKLKCIQGLKRLAYWFVRYGYQGVDRISSFGPLTSLVVDAICISLSLLTKTVFPKIISSAASHDALAQVNLELLFSFSIRTHTNYIKTCIIH